MTQSAQTEELKQLNQKVSDMERSMKKLLSPKRLLTQVKACEYLSISPTTMNELVKLEAIRQVIPPSVNGQEPRPKYDIKDLDKYIEEHKTKNVRKIV
ncbi:hypothetical protein [Vagococcus carniphilus]|uniref:hypothetical protein n=1 Tax=Vagococcus carniphilus TaxID=218144 RepID=UPI00288E5A71|nr:hypothetical protein [Vagococcus carniphilus]MDT2864647.1 hypothetical protein [Vagococcus carniphilus]